MTTQDDLLPVGLEDALPERARTMTTSMRAVLDAMDAHGYDRVRPPLVEFEHSLAVTADGFELFTESPKGLHFPPYGNS